MRITIYLLLISLTSSNAQVNAKRYPVSEGAAAALVARVLKDAPVIDGHNDLFALYYDCKTCPRDLKDYRIDTLTKGQTDIPRWRKGSLGGQLLNIFGQDQTLESYLNAYDLLYRMEATYAKDLKVVGTAKEMRAAMSQGKIAIVPSLEGSNRIKNDMALLRRYYQLGLRSVTLAYKTNALADGSDDSVRHHGLSPFGKEMVKEMNRLGIMVDISHVSAETMSDVLEVSKAPVIFSHSNARALCDVNRNAPDDVLRQLKTNNGIIMLTFVPYFTTNEFKDWMARGDDAYYKALAGNPANKEAINTIMEKWEKENKQPVVSIADMADHFDHVKKLIGVDHIGMAGDYDGIAYTITGMEDVTSYPRLLKELAMRGWTEMELKKISSENFLRVFEGVEKAAGLLQKTMKPSMEKLKVGNR